MKTKLEIGKEYWLSAQKISRGIYLGESNSGNFDFRITLGSKYTKPFGELDVMTSNLSVYSEYIPETPWQFTTPISMKCTEEQFNEIKGKLVEMGYILYGITFGEKYRYLSSNFDNDVRCITDLAIGSKYFKECNPIIFESFNPDLFLALAAMTDKEDGIKGEWWKSGLTGKLIMQSESSFSHPIIRKATAQEIIEHFEKKGKKEADRIFKLVLDFQSSLFNKINEDKTIIHIPPTKQATIFDDRVEITDWKPKDNDEVLVVSINVDGWGITKTKYKFVAEPYKAHGFIKRTESEAKSLVEKLKQAML